MEQDNDPYGRALEGILFELQECLSYRNAYNSLSELTRKMDISFFHYALRAFQDGKLLHAAKVLEKNNDSATFFYLYNYKEKHEEVRAHLRRHGLDIGDVNSLARKLKMVRDKSVVHIDKKELFDQNTIWAKAKLSDKFFGHIMETLWNVLISLYESHFGESFHRTFVYDGDDVKSIVEAVQSKKPRR